MRTVVGRALFTSIPKCGKNLVIALLNELGLHDVDQPAMGDAAAHIMACQTLSQRVAGRLPQPSIDQDVLEAYVGNTEFAFRTVIDHLPGIADRCFLHGHPGFDADLWAAARDAGLPVVFLYRDPRAMVASQAHFLIDRGMPADMVHRLTSFDIPGALKLLIEGDGLTLPTADLFASYEGWLTADGVIAVRFEDLVGPRGGGSAAGQLATVARIAQHVGWRGTSADLACIADRIFNPQVGTFRRGTIDGWRGDVPAETVRDHPEFFIDLASRWGYPEADKLTASPIDQDAVSRPSQSVGRSPSTVEEALQAALHDGDRRLEVIRALEARLADIAAERRRLSIESDERLALVRSLETRVTALKAECDRLSRESDERLLLIQALTARAAKQHMELDRLGSETDERLAIIRRLEMHVAELRAGCDRLSRESDERLALIRAHETRLLALSEASAQRSDPEVPLVHPDDRPATQEKLVEIPTLVQASA
jgi:hypothetical protein